MQWKLTLLSALVLLGFGGVEAQSHPQLCSGIPRDVPVSLRVDEVIRAPSPGGFQRLRVGVMQGDSLSFEAAADATIELESPEIWSPDPVTVELVRFLEEEVGSAPVLVWESDPPGSGCYQLVTVAETRTDPEEPGPETPDSGEVSPPEDPSMSPARFASTQQTYTRSGCVAAGQEWEQELSKQHGDDFTLLVLDPGGGSCYQNRNWGVVGDPIFVGIFTDQRSVWEGGRVEFGPCQLEPVAPSVYVSGDIPVFGGVQARGDFSLIKRPARRCFNQSLTITLFPNANQGSGASEVSVPLDQYQRYRATSQIGILWTDLHSPSYGLRTDDGAPVIYNRGPEGRGPRYFASLVLYSPLRYLDGLFSEDVYHGRDILHDTGFIDRLSAIIGVGLKHPAEEFVAGGSFELIHGVNAIGAWYWLKTTDLAGVSEGDVFLGTRGEIPTRREWVREFTWGVSFDLQYLVGLFSR